jgi:hypothetical protein
LGKEPALFDELQNVQANEFQCVHKPIIWPA